MFALGSLVVIANTIYKLQMVRNHNVCFAIKASICKMVLAQTLVIQNIMELEDV